MEKIKVKKQSKRIILRGESFLKRKQAPITFLAKNGRSFPIDATKGEKTIFTAKDLFTAGIDSCFETWGLNKPGKPTKKILAKIYGVNREESLLKTFSSISPDFKKLALEQEQIIDFCANNKILFLKEGVGTLFLTEMNDKFFPVLVIIKSKGLEAILYDGKKNVIYQFISCQNMRIITPDLTIV